jgi:hypothetical protein
MGEQLAGDPASSQEPVAGSAPLSDHSATGGPDEAGATSDPSRPSNPNGNGNGSGHGDDFSLSLDEPEVEPTIQSDAPEPDSLPARLEALARDIRDINTGTSSISYNPAVDLSPSAEAPAVTPAPKTEEQPRGDLSFLGERVGAVVKFISGLWGGTAASAPHVVKTVGTHFSLPIPDQSPAEPAVDKSSSFLKSPDLTGTEIEPPTATGSAPLDEEAQVDKKAEAESLTAHTQTLEPAVVAPSSLLESLTGREAGPEIDPPQAMSPPVAETASAADQEDKSLATTPKPAPADGPPTLILHQGFTMDELRELGILEKKGLIPNKKFFSDSPVSSPTSTQRLFEASDLERTRIKVQRISDAAFRRPGHPFPPDTQPPRRRSPTFLGSKLLGKLITTVKSLLGSKGRSAVKTAGASLMDPELPFTGPAAFTPSPMDSLDLEDPKASTEIEGDPSLDGTREPDPADITSANGADNDLDVDLDSRDGKALPAPVGTDAPFTFSDAKEAEAVEPPTAYTQNKQPAPKPAVMTLEEFLQSLGGTDADQPASKAETGENPDTEETHAAESSQERQERDLDNPAVFLNAVEGMLTPASLDKAGQLIPSQEAERNSQEEWGSLLTVGAFVDTSAANTTSQPEPEPGFLRRGINALAFWRRTDTSSETVAEQPPAVVDASVVETSQPEPAGPGLLRRRINAFKAWRKPTSNPPEIEAAAAPAPIAAPDVIIVPLPATEPASSGTEISAATSVMPTDPAQDNILIAVMADVRQQQSAEALEKASRPRFSFSPVFERAAAGINATRTALANLSLRETFASLASRAPALPSSTAIKEKARFYYKNEFAGAALGAVVGGGVRYAGYATGYMIVAAPLAGGSASVLKEVICDSKKAWNAIKTEDNKDKNTEDNKYKKYVQVALDCRQAFHAGTQGNGKKYRNKFLIGAGTGLLGAGVVKWFSDGGLSSIWADHAPAPASVPATDMSPVVTPVTAPPPVPVVSAPVQELAEQATAKAATTVVKLSTSEELAKLAQDPRLSADARNTLEHALHALKHQVKGDEWALNEIADGSLNGRFGVPQNEALGVRLFQESAAAGSPKGIKEFNYVRRVKRLAAFLKPASVVPALQR